MQKKSIEEAPPVIQETQVIVEDTQKVDSLTAEVESLKGFVWFVGCYYVAEFSGFGVLQLQISGC